MSVISRNCTAMISLLIPDAGHGVYPIARPIMFHQQVPDCNRAARFRWITSGRNVPGPSGSPQKRDRISHATRSPLIAHLESQERSCFAALHACALDLATGSPFCNRSARQPNPGHTTGFPTPRITQKLRSRHFTATPFSTTRRRAAQSADEPRSHVAIITPLFSFHAVFSFADIRFRRQLSSKTTLHNKIK